MLYSSENQIQNFVCSIYKLYLRNTEKKCLEKKYAPNDQVDVVALCCDRIFLYFTVVSNFFKQMKPYYIYSEENIYFQGKSIAITLVIFIWWYI